MKTTLRFSACPSARFYLHFRESQLRFTAQSRFWSLHVVFAKHSLDFKGWEFFKKLVLLFLETWNKAASFTDGLALILRMALLWFLGQLGGTRPDQLTRSNCPNCVRLCTSDWGCKEGWACAESLRRDSELERGGFSTKVLGAPSARGAWTRCSGNTEKFWPSQHPSLNLGIWAAAVPGTQNRKTASSDYFKGPRFQGIWIIGTSQDYRSARLAPQKHKAHGLQNGTPYL